MTIIEYKLSKIVQILAFLGSYLPLLISIYALKILGYNSENEWADIYKLFIILFFFACLYNNLIRMFLITRKLWDKFFLRISGTRMLVYDCLRGKYIYLNSDSVEGMNYYNVPFGFYPYSIFIIYTDDKKIYTCPKFIKESVDDIYDIIYDFCNSRYIE